MLTMTFIFFLQLCALHIVLPKIASSTSDQRETPLHRAIKMEETPERFRDILGSNPNTEAKVSSVSEGRTALHEAAEEGRGDIVKLLLESGANVNAKDNFRRTALHNAAHNGLVDIMKLLLESGANVDAKDNSRQTPLHQAAFSEEFQIIKFYAQRNTSVYTATIDPTDLYKVEERGRDITKLLLESGANVDAKDNSQKTPLFLAANKRHLNAAKTLLSGGADPNIGNAYGQTPLHRAVLNDDLQMIKILLENNASVNAADSAGNSPIHLAEAKGFQEAVREMRKKCPNFQTKDHGEAPRAPHLKEVNCQGRHANITWVTGSDPGCQSTLSYTIFHNESREYSDKTFQETRHHEPNAMIYKLGMVVEPWTNNSFWVTGQNNAGTSDASKVLSCNVPPDLPSGNPSDVKVSRLVPNILTVKWMEFLDAAVKATENTLRDSAVWKDLQENKRAATSTNLQEGLYKAAVKYLGYLHNETKEINHGKVAVSAANQPITYFNDPNKRVFMLPNSSYTRITLPSNFYEGYQDQNNSVKVTFMAYQNLNCINNSLPCSPDEVKSEDDMQAAAQVNSVIIGAKIGVASAWYASDGKNVVIQFEHIYNGTAYRLSGSRCVWWNVTANSWESQGCYLNATNDHYTVCHCDHLTNLAVLMDIGGRLQRGTVSYGIMQLITIIGSSVSIFSLLLCIVCFALLKKTPQGKIKGHNFSRLNLCICLLLAKVVMLAGLDATDNKPVCTIVAIILHYLFLAMLTWSATEAYQLYKNFIMVFNRDGSRKRTFLVVGYMGPLFIVILTFILSNYNGHWTDKGYGTDKACWLSKKLTWGFAGMALPILLVNMSLFVLTMKKTWEKRCQVNKAIIPKLAGSISIFLFLCLTWLFGYFYFAEGSEPFAVLFTILNSFVGVPMFIFSILLDSSIMGQVKKMIKKRNEQTQKAQLTRHNHLISKNISSNCDVKRRNFVTTTGHSIHVIDGTAWSSSGCSTPSSEETFCENNSCTDNPCGNCSSGVTISSRTGLENHVVAAIVHSRRNRSKSSVASVPDTVSLRDSRLREDFSIHEVILSSSMFTPSSQESCDGKGMAVNQGKLSYLSPKHFSAEVSLAKACDNAKVHYEKNWKCLEMQSNSQWGEQHW
ncbi:uncharacterized protein [Macrobrachium rosenbergii]|uniref:uncharacterized protein isoform X4 n=1 Tax=Macrobrachium rosenbergii TaxID=79674 RepID=UPI0034D4E9EF